MAAIRAESIELVDNEGTVRAIIDLANAQSPTIRLLDQRGNIRLGIYVLPDGSPHIQSWDSKGQLSWHTPFPPIEPPPGDIASPAPKPVEA